MENANHGPQSFREFRWRRHHSRQYDTKDVDGRQTQKRLDPKRFEDLGAIVVQLVGKGQDALKGPNHGYGETLHGTGSHVFAQFIGDHDEGVQEVAQQKEESLTTNHAVNSHEHRDARKKCKYVHEIENKGVATNLPTL